PGLRQPRAPLRRARGLGVSGTARQPQARPDRQPRIDRGIPNYLGGRRALGETRALFNYPLVAMSFDALFLQLSLGVTLLPLDSDHLASGFLKGDLIADLGLRERFRHGPLEILAPDLPVALPCLHAHEVR